MKPKLPMQVDLRGAPSRPPLFAWVALLGVALCATSCRESRSATIVVDFGAYPSADSAGRAEAHVDWTDDDRRDDSICTQCFAACELRHYLRLATGDSTGFPVADDDSLPVGDLILVGGPDANRATARLGPSLGLRPPDLVAGGPEGYVIRSSRLGGRRIVVIAGAGRVGTLYGAYDFLHRMGVRWFAPGRVNEEVPRRPWSEVAGLSVRESPRFVTRGFHAWEDRGDPSFFLWMARNRLNTWSVEEREKPLLHKLGITLVAGGHELTSLYLDPRAPYPYAHPRFRSQTSPADPYPVSPEYRGDTDGDGRLSYFEAHPEWYALRGGKRSSDIVGDRGDNFCTSNDDAMTEWMKNAIDDLAEGHYREAEIVNAWLLDGGRWCQCRRCRALGTPTDRNLLFVDRFSREIRKARAAGRIRRPIQLFFLAYADVAAPPTRPLPADFDTSTCIATFFPIARCYAHRFDDPACDINAQYDHRLRGWTTDPHRYYRGRVCLGEYYNVSGYKSLPLCLMHIMQHDIPYYASLGIRDFHYMHCTTKNWGNKALTNWQMARQLWKPDTDCNALWDDYFAGRYGAAAPSMRRFYSELERMLADVTELKYGLARRLEQDIEPLFINDHLTYARGAQSLTGSLCRARACRSLLDDLSRDRLPGRIQRRISEDDRLFTYGERTLLLYDALCRANAALHERNLRDASHALADARIVAGALRADTTSTRFSSSHANAPDALAASFASGALQRLASGIAVAAAGDLEAFDPGREPLVLDAEDFGGGVACPVGNASRRGEGAHAAEGLRAMPSDRLAARFSLAAAPGGDLYLTWTGLKHAGGSPSSVRGEVRVNGYPVAAGDVPLVADRPSSVQAVLPSSLLERGTNLVEIRNLEPDTSVKNPPWLGLERAELSGTPPTRPIPRFACRGPLDLALTYRSLVDGSEQPYRVYLPSAYDGKTRLPVLVALHGTTDSQNSFFDDPRYGHGSYVSEAEKRGIVVVCPGGRGDTEYRGIGEVDVLQVIDQVTRGFRVDPDRIVCSGFSMGGTGTTYLVLRHPDLFAGGIALSSCYEHVNMLENLRYVPTLYIQGSRDWPVYAAEGPTPITTRLRELGYPTDLWMLRGVRHNSMGASTGRMMDWALRQRRVRNPSRVTFRAYFPEQGKAYWAEIQGIKEPGYLAEVDARIEDRSHIIVRTRNASRLAFHPGPELLDLDRAVSVEIDGAWVFSGSCGADEEIACTLDRGRWNAHPEPVVQGPPVVYHQNHVGKVVVPPTQNGDAETTMGNWMTDMMRSVSGADIAIYNRRHYRGVRLARGQEIYTEDLFDWIRPYDRCLCTFRCTGQDLLEILEANILDGPGDRELLVQVSGCRYAFDRRRPPGQRIVSSTIDPWRTYTVACEGQVRDRETILLGGRSGKLGFEVLEPSAVSGAWRYIEACGGVVTAGLEGRVLDLTPQAPVGNQLANEAED